MFQKYLALILLACVLVCQAYRLQEFLPNTDSYKMYDYDESFEEKSLLHLLRDQYKNEHWVGTATVGLSVPEGIISSVDSYSISNIEHKRFSICGATGCRGKTRQNESGYRNVAAKRFSVCGSKGCIINE